MTNSTDQSKASEVTGEFLDHETGQAHSYAAKFRKVANDALWTARVNLGGRWVTVRGGRLANVGKNSDFVVSEMIRDSVIDSMYDEEMDGRMAEARRQHCRAKVRRRVIGSIVIIAIATAMYFKSR